MNNLIKDTVTDRLFSFFSWCLCFQQSFLRKQTAGSMMATKQAARPVIITSPAGGWDPHQIFVREEDAGTLQPAVPALLRQQTGFRAHGIVMAVFAPWSTVLSMMIQTKQHVRIIQ